MVTLCCFVREFRKKSLKFEYLPYYVIKIYKTGILFVFPAGLHRDQSAYNGAVLYPAHSNHNDDMGGCAFSEQTVLCFGVRNTSTYMRATRSNTYVSVDYAADRNLQTVRAVHLGELYSQVL